MIFPDMVNTLYFLIWCTIYHMCCLCCSSYNNSCYGVHPISRDVAFFLYLLMWCTKYCISWCDSYIVFHTYIISPDMAYILRILIWDYSCTDMPYSVLSLLVWRIYCSSHIYDISWYGVHPVSLAVAYFSYFLMWYTIYRLYWCGVYIFLHWHT